MTPEPTGGVYRNDGVAAFLGRFGYPDKNGKVDRRNFGGIYTVGKDFHPDTGVKLVMNGFNSQTGKLTDLDGGIMLVDRNEMVAASWSFKGMMAHLESQTRASRVRPFANKRSTSAIFLRL